VLDGIVRHQKKAFLILAAILIIGWLIGPTIAPLVIDLIEHLRGNWAGEVFGEKISWREYGLLRHRLEGYARALGRPAVSDDELWRHLVLLKEAERLHIDAGPKDVRDFIVRRFGREGKLSPAEYRAILDRSGLSRKKFEECVRDTIRQGRLQRLVWESPKVSDSEAWQAYKDENTEYSVKYMRVSLETFLEGVKEPSEEELKEYFASHKESFREPERVRIAVLGLLYDDLLKEVSVSEEEAYAFYEEHIDDYRIAGKEASGVKEGAASEGSEGGASEETKAEEVPVRYKPFEDVRGEIEKALKEQRSRDLAWDLVDDEATGLFEEGASFEEVRRELPKLSYWETDFFSREEASKIPPIAGSRGYDEEGKLRDFASIAFEISGDEVSPPLSNEKGRFIFRVVERKQSYIPELRAVRERVKEAVRREKAREKALEFAEGLRKKIEDGGSFESVASAAKLKVEKEGPLKAQALPPFAREVISLDAGKTGEPVPFDDAFYIVQLSEKKEPERAAYSSEAKDYKKRLLAFERFLFLSRWESSLRKRANLKVYKPKGGQAQGAAF